MESSFGSQALRAYMERQGMNGTQLAYLLGVDISSVSRLLSGSLIPSLRLAAKIQRYTGIEAVAWITE